MGQSQNGGACENELRDTKNEKTEGAERYGLVCLVRKPPCTENIAAALLEELLDAHVRYYL